MPKFGLVTATLLAATGKAEDSVVMDFSVRSPDAFDPTAQLGQITTAINASFNVAPQVGTDPLSYFLSNQLSRATGAIQYRYYDVTGKLGLNPATGRPYPHGSPVAQDAGTLGTTSASVGLPEEVALVATLRAEGWTGAPVETADGTDYGTAIDRPKQRHTGRQFVGPLILDAVAAAAPPSRPSTELINSVGRSRRKLVEDLAVNDHDLCVWSRQDGVMRPVVLITVDNAWDTQRRRGTDPSGQSQFTPA